MAHDREDRICELQQALAEMRPDQWASFLAHECPHNVSLRDEVVRRQRAMEGSTARLHAVRLVDTQLLSPSSIEATPAPNHNRILGDLSSRFEVRRELGSGGFGIVYHVHDRH